MCINRRSIKEGTIEVLRMLSVEAKVIPVIRGATAAISESYRQ